MAVQTVLDFREEFLNKSSDPSKLALGLTQDGLYERNYLSVYSLMPHTDDMATEDLYQYTLVRQGPSINDVASIWGEGVGHGVKGLDM